MTTRKRLDAQTSLAHAQHIAAKAAVLAAKGKPAMARYLYPAAAAMVVGAMSEIGLDGETMGKLTLAAAQYFELAGDAELAAKYAEKARELRVLDSDDMSKVRAIADRVGVAA
jgi:hypothetical protein